MEIQMMRPEDVPGVLKIRTQHRLHVIPDIYLGTDKPVITSEWRARTEERLMGLLDNPEHFVLTARTDGLVAGFALCEVTGATVPDGLTTDLQVGYIDTVHVLASQRRQGIARRLVAEAERAFQERGLGYSELAYWRANGSAVMTWPALGYTPLHETVRRELCSVATADSTTAVGVRPMTANDRPDLLRLCLDRVQHLKNLDDPYMQSALTRTKDADELGATLAEIGANRLGLVLVAESDGRITGFAAGKVDYPIDNPSTGVKPAGEFAALYAHPGAALAPTLQALESAMTGFFAANDARHAHIVGVRTADIAYRRFWQAGGYEPFHYQAWKPLDE